MQQPMQQQNTTANIQTDATANAAAANVAGKGR